MSEFLGEALSRTSRIRPVHPGQNDQTGGPFDQGPDGRAIASPLESDRLPSGRAPYGWPPRRDAQRAASYWGSARVDRPLAPEGDAPCGPAATRPAVRCARNREAAVSGHAIIPSCGH